MTRAEPDTPLAVELSPPRFRGRMFRPTVADLMVVVLIAAMVMSSGGAFLSHLLYKALVWASIPTALVAAIGRFGPRWLAVAASVGMAGAGAGLVMMRVPIETFGNDPTARLMTLVVFMSFCGPPLLAGRIASGVRRGPRPTVDSGSILWAWLGLAWLALLADAPIHGGRNWYVVPMAFAEAARWTAAVAIGLVRWGRRPARPGDRIAHDFGWALAEATVISWGWTVAHVRSVLSF